MGGLKYVVSADSHIMEPFDLWTKALGDKHGGTLPQVVNEYRGEKTKFYFTGYEYIKIGDFEPVDTSDSQGGSQSLEDEMLEKIDRTNKDPDLRLELMDQDGVSAEIVNPTYLLYTLRTPNKVEMVKDCCTVYNDYIADYVSTNPTRMLGTSMIDMEDIDWAVSELERTRKRNLRTVIINTDVRDGMLPYRDKAYDRFWAAAQDLEVPVTLHIITGNVRDPFTLFGEERRNTARDGLNICSEALPVLLNEFIMGEIMDRFPKLKLVLSEYEVSWLPYFMFRGKQMIEAFGPALSLPKIKSSIEDYMGRVYHGFIDDTWVDHAIEAVDHRTLMWGSDFPHPDGVWPDSKEFIKQELSGVSDATRQKIICGNAAALYGFE